MRERILSSGTEAIPILIEVLLDETLAMEDGPGKGYAPIHAARLLGELGATEAIEPLLRQMTDTTWDEILHDAIIQSLPKIGSAVVEPTLHLLAETADPEVRHSVRAVLSEVGVRDDRIREALVAELEVEPDLGAMHLASYGDSSVLPLLHAAFDRHPIERREAFANQALIELEAAIEDLGGELTPAQKDKVERAINFRRAAPSDPNFEVEDDLDEAMPVRAAEKLGRNEPPGHGRLLASPPWELSRAANVTLAGAWNDGLLAGGSTVVAERGRAFGDRMPLGIGVWTLRRPVRRMALARPTSAAGPRCESAAAGSRSEGCRPEICRLRPHQHLWTDPRGSPCIRGLG